MIRALPIEYIMEYEVVACQAAAIEHSDHMPLWKLAFNQHGGQTRQSGPFSSQCRLQSSCYPTSTDSCNHRRQIPDRFLHGVKAKQPGCIWLRSKPFHSAKKKKKKHTLKQPKQDQKRENPASSSVLTVIQIEINCRKGRQHTTRFVFLLFLMLRKLIEFVC